MKKYWHTKTLFIQRWNWKYKWSYKYDHCIECGKCDKKHKWKWLCTRCRDKKRDNNQKRKEQKYKAWLKYHQKNYNPVIEKKERIKTFDIKSYRKIRYNKNKELIKLKLKTQRMIKKWLSCMQMIIKWKIYFLPFTEMIEKPCITGNNFKLYNERKEQQKQFILIKSYYENPRNNK